jgi:hypothetical protein
MRALCSAARSPLVRFMAIGGVIFALSARRENARHVAIDTASLVAFERAQAERDGVTSLAPERRSEVDARAIEDEILYREGLRLGLDREDPIIRQRVIQKVLLLAEDLGGASRAPTEAELRTYLAVHRENFEIPARVRLVHVFASRENALPPDASLTARGIPLAGEAFPYSRDVQASRDDLTKSFGDEFASAVFALPEGHWSAPVASKYGWHRVRVDAFDPPRGPSFEEVRANVAFAYILDKRADVIANYLEKASREYRIEVGGHPLSNFAPTRRVATRTEASAED